jgi:heat shock protein HslJ
MKKIIMGILAVAVVLGAGFFILNSYIYKEKQGAGMAMNHKDATYVIDGRPVSLVNGMAETEAAPGSATKVVTKYFGNEVRKDLDADGREDIVFLLTQETGGSGTFFYVVAALNTENGYVGSQALLLGDRIAPQTTEAGDGKMVIVNYAERKQGEPMTAQPSVGKSLQLLLDPELMQFGEVVRDFEGEADPARMSLDMKKWEWVRAEYNDGRVISPKQPGKFTITFKTDGDFSVTTDCNTMGGGVKTMGEAINFDSIVSTKMYCEGSQEGEFAQMLVDSTSYHFTSKGELILDLKMDSGSVIFI